MKQFNGLPTPIELSKKIDELMELLQKRSTTIFFGLVPLKAVEKRVNELINDAIDLQSQLLLFNGNLGEFQWLRTRVIEFERRANFIKLQKGFLNTALLTYLGGCVAVYIIIKVDIGGFIVKNLGVDAPEKLVSLGVAGAGLFVATDYLQKSEILTKGNKIAVFLIRLALAIVVPIVLVVLFFEKNGTVKKLSFSPEVLSFVCGYSSKVVISLFNKIVEKATKMIEAI